MAPTIRAAALLAAGCAAAALLLIGGGPAGGDYAPYVTLDVAEASPGSVVVASSDSTGACAEPGDPPEAGDVTVEMGSLAVDPDIGGFVVLDDVLVSSPAATDEAGHWRAELTVPADAAVDELVVTAHCYVNGRLLFDYYPARLTVTGEATPTSTSTTTSTTAPLVVIPPPPATPAPAEAVSGSPVYTG